MRSVGVASVSVLGLPAECPSQKDILCEHECKRSVFGDGRSCVNEISTPAKACCEITGWSPSDCEGNTGGTTWDCFCTFEGGF